MFFKVNDLNLIRSYFFLSTGKSLRSTLKSMKKKTKEPTLAEHAGIKKESKMQTVANKMQRFVKYELKAALPVNNVFCD